MKLFAILTAAAAVALGAMPTWAPAANCTPAWGSPVLVNPPVCR